MLYGILFYSKSLLYKSTFKFSAKNDNNEYVFKKKMKSPLFFHRGLRKNVRSPLYNFFIYRLRDQMALAQHPPTNLKMVVLFSEYIILIIFSYSFIYFSLFKKFKNMTRHNEQYSCGQGYNIPRCFNMPLGITSEN